VDWHGSSNRCCWSVLVTEPVCTRSMAVQVRESWISISKALLKTFSTFGIRASAQYPARPQLYAASCISNPGTNVAHRTANQGTSGPERCFRAITIRIWFQRRFTSSFRNRHRHTSDSSKKPKHPVCPTIPAILCKGLSASEHHSKLSFSLAVRLTMQLGCCQ
jgi:hypothetical protein